MCQLSHEELLWIAAQRAQRSPLKHHKNGAIITVREGPYVAAGWSHVAEWNRGLYSIHAEIAALNKLRPKGAGVAAYVACLTEAGNIGLAKPCLSCAIALQAAGIRFVCYTVKGSRTNLDYAEINLNAPGALEGLKEYRRVS